MIHIPNQSATISLFYFRATISHFSLHFEILKPTTTSHHSKAVSRSLLLCLNPRAKQPFLGPQQMESHWTSHAYQLCKPTNGRAGWPAMTCIKGAKILSGDSFRRSKLSVTHQERIPASLHQDGTIPGCPATMPHGPSIPLHTASRLHPTTAPFISC